MPPMTGVSSLLAVGVLPQSAFVTVTYTLTLSLASPARNGDDDVKHVLFCRLTIPASDIDTMKNGVYTIHVTVTNWLGATQTASATFEKLVSGQAPVVSVAGGTQQTFKIADGLQLTSQLLATSVCSGKKVGSCTSPRMILCYYLVFLLTCLAWF